MRNFIISAEDILNAKKTSLGSLSFLKNYSQAGNTLTRLNSAIVMGADEFKADSRNENGYCGLQEYYELLKYNFDRCFTYEEACVAGSHAVFSFVYNDTQGWKCLNDAELPINEFDALNIFKELLLIIKEYSQKVQIHNNGYRPMSFICRDSVYIREDINGDKELRLLPLPYNYRSDYAGLPRKADDVYTDVYMAAYLFLDLKYPEGRDFNEADEADALAERCLSPFPQRRMALDELIDRLSQISMPDDPGIKNCSESSEEETASKEETVYTNVHFDEDEVGTPKSRTRVNIDKKIQSGAKKINKGKKKVRKAFDDMREQFDKRFSTEKGDAYEDKNDD
ncbi:MAG: hypothetical protein E7591_04525 [Ruminococcaceae bacterium]|nr:hypothetical protein [Oscillospiraceae bacterium]